LTYRKGKTTQVPKRSFCKRKVTIGEREVSFDLAEKRIRLRGCRVRLRQVTVLGEDGYQTQIITSNATLEAPEVAYRMFDRWRQENFFKYMLEEYALDALADYGTEPADPARTVPNPKRKRLDKEITSVRAELAALERQYGTAAIENSEARRPTMRGFKIANASLLGNPLKKTIAKLKRLQARRSKLPARVPVSETTKKGAPLRLRTETRRVGDVFKMLAYRAETALVSLVRPHYPRTEQEGRTLIASALQSSGSLVVTSDELQVTLDPMSSPHKTRAIQVVCDRLNERPTMFPGTTLRLRLAVRHEKCVTD
jgi:hypothetical protein